MAATAALLILAMIYGHGGLAEGFYAPTDALCQTGPTAVDRSLDRPQVSRAVNAQKISIDSRYPNRLIIDNAEICFVRSRSRRSVYLSCSYGEGTQEAWRYGYHVTNGVIYLDQRPFRYCGPIDRQ